MKFGYFSLKIEGFNQLKLYSELGKNQIKITDLKKVSPSVCSFSVRKKDSAKTFAILEKMCYNYSIQERFDSVSVLRTVAARAGLIIALILFSAALALSYGFIWRIEITGNEKVDTLTIKRALNSCGIYEGKSLKNVDKNYVEGLLNSFDEIIETSVEISGTTLKIEVVEKTDYISRKPPSNTDILGLCDAEVTRVVAYQGTALVSAGSRVFRGQSLIGVYRINSQLEQVFTPAEGQIYGKVAFTRTVEISDKEYTTVRTGKTYRSSAYSLFGLKIKGKTKHGFKTYETETKKINVFEGLFIPLKLTQTTYYKTETKEIEFDINERAEYFKNLLVNEIVINAGGSEIETSYVLTKGDNGLYKLTVYMVAEMLIGSN